MTELMNELWGKKSKDANICQTQDHRIKFSNKKWARHTIISQIYRGMWDTYSGGKNTGENLHDYCLLGFVQGLYMG